MLKKLLASAVALLVILPAVVSCSSETTPTTSLIPASASMVVKVQVGNILTNPALRIAYDELARAYPGWPQTADEATSQLLQKTGLDISSISSAIFFADIETTGQAKSDFAGLIATGVFDESALVARAQQQAQQKLVPGNYGGFTIYIGAQDAFEIVFFGKDRLVVGTPKAVRDTIDVKNGTQKPLSGSIMQTLDRFGNSLITGAFTMPESLRNEIGAAVPQQPAVSLTAFQDIDIVGFAIDQPGLNLSIRFDAHFTSIASAQDGKDTLTGLVSIAKGTSQDPDARAILDGIQVTTADSWLSVRAVSSLTEIGALISSVQTQR